MRGDDWTKVIALFVHTDDAQRLGFGDAVEVDDFDVAEFSGTV